MAPAQKVQFSRRDQLVVYREATGCHTQQSDCENHGGKTSVPSGSFARGTEMLCLTFLFKAALSELSGTRW